MKRYALLLTMEDTAYIQEHFGGWFKVYLRAFQEEGEKWDLFRVVEGVFPSEKDLVKYDGFVISGSPHKATGHEPWILRLCSLIRTLDSIGEENAWYLLWPPDTVSGLIGGYVGEAFGGWDLSIRKVSVISYPRSWKSLGGPEHILSSASIIECHRDVDWTLPLRAKLVAFSQKTAVESFEIDDHVLGIQGHPEFTKDILYYIIDSLVDDHSIDVESAEEAKAQVRKAKPDKMFWEKVSKDFLKGKKKEN